MDAVLQLNTALAGRYEVEREIGAGGMATVFLARDLKHNRRVALKVLRPDLGAVLGLERFLAEIQVTANLQHPNLLPLFDSGEADGQLFYVMPFVEGESLRVRLTREKQLPIDDAIRITTAIAAALDYAHRNGVIHRDLKPENILLQDGQPVVADFGIALAVSKAGGARITQTGLSLGTPQYMSPEQATGDRVIDSRTDVYSLAAMTYEMLSGEPPHIGNTSQAVIARVLTEVPRSIRMTRPSVPEHVDESVLCGLEKLPADRFATAGELAAALSGARPARAAGATSGTLSRRATSPRREWPMRAGLVAAAVLITGVTTWMMARRPVVEFPVLPTTRARIALPDRMIIGTRPLTVSRDGKTVAFVAVTDSARRVPSIYIRRSDELQIRAVVGTEGGTSPAFSPDGAWLAFRVADSIMKVPAVGGVPTYVGPVGHSFSWAPDGRFFFTAPLPERAIYQIGASGGPATLVVKTDSVGPVRWPDVMPDARTLLFTGVRGDSLDVRLLDLTSGRSRILIASGSRPRYLDSGHLAYVADNNVIMVVSFDLRRGELTGVAVPVLQSVGGSVGTAAQFDVSHNGTAVYTPGSQAGPRLFLLKEEGQAETIPIDAREFRSVRFSPDGRRLLYGQRQGETAPRTYVHDLALGTKTALLPGRNSWDPIWSPDGRSVALSTIEPDKPGFVGASVAADGTGEPKLLFRRAGLTAPQAWFADGRFLARGSGEGRPGARGSDLHIVSLAGDSALVTPYLRADWNESHAVAAPDGRWVAYVSDESGQRQVYVRPFPDASAGRWQISERGGTDPVWSRDGSTLYYWEGDDLRAARVRTQPGFAVVERSTVFKDPTYAPSCCFPNYDVHPDGKRFVIARRPQSSEQPGFILVTNWLEELKARR